jgi:hypothetical protein
MYELSVKSFGIQPMLNGIMKINSIIIRTMMILKMMREMISVKISFSRGYRNQMMMHIDDYVNG